MISRIRNTAVVSMVAVIFLFSAGSAGSTGLFGIESLSGDYVVSADGGFVAMTPFAEDPLRLSVAMVGRLTFDGNGLVYGNWTISFHNEAVPFGVRSHFAATGTYEVETDGHTFMHFEEFRIEPPSGNDGVADAEVGFECYIVRRNLEARCVLNMLTSFGQGPEPVPQPVTLSGPLLRQY